MGEVWRHPSCPSCRETIFRGLSAGSGGECQLKTALHWARVWIPVSGWAQHTHGLLDKGAWSKGSCLHCGAVLLAVFIVKECREGKMGLSVSRVQSRGFWAHVEYIGVNTGLE